MEGPKITEKSWLTRINERWASPLILLAIAGGGIWLLNTEDTVDGWKWLVIALGTAFALFYGLVSLVGAFRNWTDGETEDAATKIIVWGCLGTIGISLLFGTVGVVAGWPGWAVLIIILLIILILK